MDDLIIVRKKSGRELRISEPDSDGEVEINIEYDATFYVTQDQIPLIIKYLTQCLKQKSHDDKR